MQSISTKRIVLNGLMIALVFLTTRFTAIPVGIGYFNIGDVAIMITAVLLGRNSGFLAGSIGSALSDALSPFSYYAPITFVVKGLEGYIMGSIAYSAGATKKGEITRIVAVVAGVVFMIAGYFIGDFYVLRFVGQNYGLTTAVGNLPTNVVQASASAVVGYILTTILSRSQIKNVLE